MINATFTSIINIASTPEGNFGARTGVRGTCKSCHREHQTPSSDSEKAALDFPAKP